MTSPGSMKPSDQLNTLLFELGRASSPLERARIAVRSWRALRRLSPWERKVLAREAGFEGAEELLEGLSTGGGGFTPAAVMQALAKIRGRDPALLSDLVADLRDPEKREEAVLQGLDLAAELVEPAPEESTEEEVEGGVEADADSSAVEALAALRALEDAEEDEDAEIEAEDMPQIEDAPEAVVEEVAPEPAPAPRPPEPLVDWNRWERAATVSAVVSSSAEPKGPTTSRAPQREDERNLLAITLKAERSVLGRLQLLRRELESLGGARVGAVRRLLEAFPERWARRRALSALFEAGIPADPNEAIELVAELDSALDRRWCLGTLAERGDLRGRTLDRALELLTSPASRRRVAAAAGS